MRSTEQSISWPAVISQEVLAIAIIVNIQYRIAQILKTNLEGESERLKIIISGQ